MDQYIIAHDVGTSGNKAVLVGTDGRIHGKCSAPFQVHYPMACRAEQEPAEEMGAGRAYLLKRRAATQRREASAQAGAELAEEIHAALAGGTVPSRLAPQTGG
jgi:glycerol kinase